MPTISKDVWITREGHQMEIKHMASSHLLSAIHFIERNRLNNASEVYHEQQLGEDRLNAVAYYLEWPLQYETLIAEAVRRKLLYRPEAPTSQGVIIREVEVPKERRLKR
jgi:hypothetical protein